MINKCVIQQNVTGPNTDQFGRLHLYGFRIINKNFLVLSCFLFLYFILIRIERTAKSIKYSPLVSSTIKTPVSSNKTVSFQTRHLFWPSHFLFHKK